MLLYEMLTSSLPFVAQHSFDFMAAHVREEPQPIQALRPELVPEVAELVHGMLLKDPVERPSMSTVVALIEELAAAAPGLQLDLGAPRPRLSRDAIPRLGRDALGRSTPSGSHDAAGGPGQAALALGATAPGLVSASSATQKELLELGATVAGRSPARLSRDALDRAQLGLGPSSQSGRGRDAPSLPPQPVPEPLPPAPLPSRRARAVRLGGIALLVLLALPVAWLAVRRAPASAPTAPAVERTVKWAVISKPAGAEVVRSDGQVLGSTPWQVTRPADSGETVITLRHPGFQDKRLLLSHATDVSTEVALAPAPPVAAPPAAVAPGAPGAAAGPSEPSEPTEPRRSGKRKAGKASARGKKKDQDVQLLID
ncbi:MAG: hypothetical protein U1A78_16895 [Polyangia bacterium]